MNRREVVVGISAFGLFGESPAAGNCATKPAPAVEAPASAGWPDGANTGVPADTRLSPSKALNIARDGAVIDALDIDGAVNIAANHVTLRRCRIRAAAFSVIRIQKGVAGAVIEDCEIDGVGIDNDGCNGIFGSGVFQRNNIYHVENGVAADGGAPTVIADNYIHDMLASGSPHYDCIQIDGNVANVVIRHNTAINQYTQTSAVMINNYFGPITDVLVENNLLMGGGYTIYVDARFNSSAVSNVRIVNNHMGPGKWGVTAFPASTPVYEGNVVDGFSYLKTLRRTI